MAQLKYWDGTAWVSAVVGAQGPVGPTGGVIAGFNAQTGTSYTLAAGDVNALVTASNTGAITITVPPSVFSSTNVINVQRLNTGLVTFAAGSGVTITSTGATSAAPRLRARFSMCSVICTGSNTFTIVGDIT
jgi:hypothetical protein